MTEQSRQKIPAARAFFYTLMSCNLFQQKARMTGRMTLLELNTLVSDTIGKALAGKYWVEAELMEIREVRGHCYMDVVQKDMFSSALVARASAKCWRSQWSGVSEKFMKATGGLPEVGMKLLLSVSVNFHAAYGFSLIVDDIDPAYTLGEMAQKRRETIQKLKEEGVYDLQRELCLPLFCQRIAVISSATAAGYGDFCNQLECNEYGFDFVITLFRATMQGEQTEKSIISQLEKIDSRLDEFDCVVIIRGGGATADMSAFDSLALAENVANFPIPVITGIGHERDECVLDLISYYRAKTPTAVAAFLIDHLADVLSRIVTAQDTIASAVGVLIERHRSRLDQLSSRIKSGSALYCSKAENKIGLTEVRLENAVKALLQKKKHRFELIEQRIASLDPNRMLRRGYTLTTFRGRIVRDAKKLKTGAEVETIFFKGKAKSTITGTEYGNTEI